MMDDRFDRTEKIRKGLKKADDFEMQFDDNFFDKLHDKIMAEVDKTEVAPPPMLMTPRNLLRAHWRGWLYPLGGVASLFVFTSMLLGQVSKVNQSMQRVGLISDGHERIVAEALLDPTDLSQTLISTQSESDFFVDVATESIETLSVSKFNQIMGEGRR
ncbi:hypothetical protein [Bdellovibrio sp. HCB2-146]|uniref:hypothetical protein n=1 Tax=Bdellovibrio sp. HCB2-146 TaxID=3394362 RepID=UPI0039BD30CD